jgi:hypothetical protein
MIILGEVKHERSECVMSRLEVLAMRLQAHLQENVGETEEWPIQICGDDAEITRLIELLNEVQLELKARGLNTERFCFGEVDG